MADHNSSIGPSINVLRAGVALNEPKATAVIYNASGEYVDSNSCQGPYKLGPGTEGSVAQTTAGAVDVTVHLKGQLLDASNIKTIVVAVPFELNEIVAANFESAFRTEWPYPNVKIDVIADLRMAVELASPSSRGLVIHSGIRDRELALNHNGRDNFAIGQGRRETFVLDSVKAARAAIGGKAPGTSLVSCFDKYLGLKGLVNFETYYGSLVLEDRVRALNEMVGMVMHQAWHDQDNVSLSLADTLAKSYAEQSVTSLRKVQLDKEPVAISVYGDIWKYGDLVRRPFLKYVRRVVRDAYLDEQTHSLDEAAALRAVRRTR